jgi:hypothetical protein
VESISRLESQTRRTASSASSLRTRRTTRIGGAHASLSAAHAGLSRQGRALAISGES